MPCDFSCESSAKDGTSARGARWRHAGATGIVSGGGAQRLGDIEEEASGQGDHHGRASFGIDLDAVDRYAAFIPV